MGESSTHKLSSGKSREERVAEALRSNLRKRKDQQRHMAEKKCKETTTREKE